MNRSIGILACFGLGLAAVALPSPAQAADLSITVDCSVPSQTTPSGFNDGDVLVFSVGDTCKRADVGKGLISAQGDISITGTVTTTQDAVTYWRYFWTAGDVTEIRVTTKDPITEGDAFQEDDVSFLSTSNESVRYQFASSAPSPDPTPSSASSGVAGSAPASEIQQFGLPASGNCEDGVTEEMDWSGIGMDGWGISWAQWMNEGAGGAVCTRTVVYDTLTAKWTVN